MKRIYTSRAFWQRQAWFAVLFLALSIVVFFSTGSIAAALRLFFGMCLLFHAILVLSYLLDYWIDVIRERSR